MKSTHTVLTLAMASATVLAALGQGNDQDAKAPPLVAVEQGPFHVIHEFEGSFGAQDAFETRYTPKQYSGSLKVVSAAAEGEIKKGAQLVQFDTETIDEQIVQAELDLSLAKNRLERQIQEANRKEEAHAIDLKSAQMAFESAKHSFENYKNVLMPMEIEEAKMGLKSSEDRLKDEEAQFIQLQKMYKVDDLVEETEEIVMRRAQRGLEQRRKSMEFTRARHDLRMDIDIPRSLENLEFAFRKATNKWELTKATSTLQIEQSATELEKAKLSLARIEKNLQELREDREGLTVNAPQDGFLIHGQLVRGKWSRLQENAKALEPGGRCQAGQVLMTIVQQGPSLVCTSVPESALLQVNKGQEGVISPSADPDLELPGVVTQVAMVSTNNQFNACLEVSKPDPRLLPGHSCKIEIITEKRANALSVPSEAILKEGDEHFVHVWRDDEASRQKVTVGPECRGRTVIESGLKAGMNVVAKPGSGS